MSKPAELSNSSIPLVDDIPAPDEKPKNKGGRPKGSKTKPRTDTAPPRPRTAPTKIELRDGIAGMYGFGGAVLVVVNKQAAKVIVEESENIADAWIELCNQSPAVKRFWENAVTGGATGKVVMAHIPVVLALLPGDKNPLSSLFGGGVSPVRNAATQTAASAPPPPPPPPPAPGDVGDGVPFNAAFADQASGVG